MILSVLAPGLHSLVVDSGRPGYRSLGVTVGGAADQAAFAISNALVGNPPNAAAVEIGWTGPTLQAGGEAACVVYGAAFELDSDRQRLSTAKPSRCTQTRFFRSEAPAKGCGHTSVCTAVCRNPWCSVAARPWSSPGDEVHCEPGRIHGRFLRPNWTWNREPRTLRVVDGPQADWFRREEFYRQEFTITPACDRIGLRLRGTPLTMPAARARVRAGLPGHSAGYR